jgi:hypothetical protein
MVVVRATNMTRIEARLDIPSAIGSESRWFASRAVHRGRVELDPDEILAPGGRGVFGLQISGHDGVTLVARRRETLELG